MEVEEEVEVVEGVVDAEEGKFPRIRCHNSLRILFEMIQHSSRPNVCETIKHLRTNKVLKSHKSHLIYSCFIVNIFYYNFTETAIKFLLDIR